MTIFQWVYGQYKNTWCDFCFLEGNWTSLGPGSRRNGKWVWLEYIFQNSQIINQNIVLGNKEKKQNWSSTPYKNLTLKASLLAISQLLSLPAEKCFITKDILLILGQLVRDFQKKNKPYIIILIIYSQQIVIWKAKEGNIEKITYFCLQKIHGWIMSWSNNI